MTPALSKMISLVKIRIQDEPIKTQERGIKRLEKGCDWDLGSTPSRIGIKDER
jgi:hypothetical protein